MEAEGWDGAKFALWMNGQLRRRDWKPADLAKRLGMPSGTISRWLSGRRQPSTGSCDHIADVLGADPDTVLTLAGHRPTTEPLRPDDPRTRIISLVKRIDMQDWQVRGLEAMLREWLELEQENRRTRKRSG